MALRVRRPLLGLADHLDTRELESTSRLVAERTGLPVPANKPVVGGNTLAHAGSLQPYAGPRAHPPYALMPPAETGPGANPALPGAPFGRLGLRLHLERMGFVLDPAAFQRVWVRCLEAADRNQPLTDAALAELVAVAVRPQPVGGPGARPASRVTG